MDFSEQLFARFSGCRLFCGFSGGADSTAALLLARKYQEKFRYGLSAVHFNHHLRGAESDREAEATELFAKKYAIPFLCIDLNLPSDENLESAARNARLEEWKKLTSTQKSAVVLGHHADDRRENLLIRLCRGSNSWGLSSMRGISEVDGVTFLRPLLAMTRRDIETFLSSQGITTWAQDSSNTSTLFLRNYLRQELLPGLESRFPGSLKGMERSLNALEDDADFINTFVSAIPPEKKRSIAFWRTLHNAVKIRLLRELTGTLPGYDLLERLNRELEKESPELRRIPVGQGVEIFLRNDTIGKGVPPCETPAPVKWAWRKEDSIRWGNWELTVTEVEKAENFSEKCAFFDAAQLPEELEISAPLPGERMLPFGAKSEQKIKKLRTDRHLHSEDLFPLLRAGKKIIWALSVRHSAHGAVTAETKKIVKIEFQKIGVTP